VILSDRDLSAAVAEGTLRIDPYDPASLQPASYDLHLADSFAVQEGDDWRVMEGWGRYNLMPGEFILGSTAEVVGLPSFLVAMLVGCSTEARRGLIVESAGFIDPGFQGQLTLELACLGKRAIRLEAGQRIAQLAVYRMTSPALHPYSSERNRYQGQMGATAPREAR
jgi:dCTP deaminase